MSRGLQLALVLATSLGVQVWNAHTHSADAKGKSDDSSSDDDDEEGTSSGDGKGVDDPDEPDEDDKEQPPVTAGGLFTINTYPQRELSRPLTMTEHISQLRLSTGTDVSAKGAFETFGVGLEGIIGIKDNFSLIGGFTDAYNFKQFSAYFGFEGGLVYDLFDIRVAANLHRNAIPHFCDQDNALGMAPANCNNDGQFLNVPDGVYDAGGTQFSLDVGFPFRYSFTPQIAIVALQTLISFDFNRVEKDHVKQVLTGANMDMVTTQAVGDDIKPDLVPSLGIATNPIPPISIVVFAQFKVPDFDTTVGNFEVPVTGRIEVSPNQKLDIGIDFTLLNVKPPDPQSPLDNRFLSLFMQARI